MVEPELQPVDESVGDQTSMVEPELQPVDDSVEEKPVIVEENKEDDPIKTALMEQLKQIEEQTAKIKSQLYPEAAGGGGFNKVLKKRKKTFYKKYKSKISTKRRNKTSRNK
jgi:GTPase involved in cell partitioning and DNA repair